MIVRHKSTEDTFESKEINVIVPLKNGSVGVATASITAHGTIEHNSGDGRHEPPSWEHGDEWAITNQDELEVIDANYEEGDGTLTDEEIIDLAADIACEEHGWEDFR